MSLRSQIIRLAHQNADLRPALLQVLARYQPHGMGSTDESEKIRWHVFASAVRVWDLKDAGRRGRKVERFALYDIDYANVNTLQTAIDVWIKGLKKNTFAQALKAANDLVVLSQEAEGPSIKLSKGLDRGVDVAPGGFKPFKANWEFVVVESGYESFSIRDKVDRNNLPACIPAIKGGAKSIPVFYRWVQDNEAKLKGMQFYELLGEMSDMGIKYHSYCRMD